jgi:hypothetical protein
MSPGTKVVLLRPVFSYSQSLTLTICTLSACAICRHRRGKICCVRRHAKSTPQGSFPLYHDFLNESSKIPGQSHLIAASALTALSWGPPAQQSWMRCEAPNPRPGALLLGYARSATRRPPEPPESRELDLTESLTEAQLRPVSDTGQIDPPSTRGPGTPERSVGLERSEEAGPRTGDVGASSGPHENRVQLP